MAPKIDPLPEQLESEQTVKDMPISFGRKNDLLGKVLRFLVTITLVVALPLIGMIAVTAYQITVPSKIVSTKTPADVGNLAYEDVLLTTSDGLTLTAWHIPAKTPTDAAVLVLHGYPTDKGDVLERAAFLADKYDLLLVDFRSFGGSGGAFTTYGALEVKDALAGIDWLAAHGKTRIGIYGYSMGGAVALMTLPKTNKVTAVVAEESYADMEHLLERAFEYVGPFKKICARIVTFTAKAVMGIDLDAASPLVVVANSTLPILLVHSVGDQAVPFSDYLLLSQAMKANTHGLSFSPSGTPEDQRRSFSKAVRAFFKTNLDLPEPVEPIPVHAESETVQTAPVIP